ncbi:hypothetical protein NESM_000555900 [Novymonas esmeraldas]|uniref:Uncharacterized protein n=1 Tax=Novymonas esmeraldas TaxID=1808958 RepID=A0AAW0ERT0_9TRYP
MYGGYYGMNPGMHPGGAYGAGPMMQQQQQQQFQRAPPPHAQYAAHHSTFGMQLQPPSQPPPPHIQARLRGGGPNTSAMNNNNNGGGLGQLHCPPSYMMMHNQNSFGQPGAMLQRVGSLQSMGSMGMGPRFGSFNAGAGGGGNPYQTHGSFSSSAAGSLHRVNSGLNFDYSTGGGSHMQQQHGGPLLRRNSYGSMRQGGGSFFGGSVGSVASAGGPGAGAGGGGGSVGAPQPLARQNSAVGSYSYGSFRERSFTQGSVHNGATGLGPGLSLNSINGAFQNGGGGGGGGGGSVGNGSPRGPAAAAAAAAGPTGTQAESPTAALARQDSAKSLQRHYSIAGQFYKFGGGGGGEMDAAAAPVHGQPRFPQMMHGGGGGGMMTLNALTAAIGHRGGVGAMTPQMMQHQMMQQQRRISGGGDGSSSADPDAPPSKGTSENSSVAEGQPQALGRKNSVQNLTRKNSEKRVGMYFKNKEATEQDGVQYKKDGDPGTSGKNNSRARDPSLTNTLKASILLDISAGRSAAIEVDGRTIRADKPGAEEVQKYDMRDIIYVNRSTDVQLSSDSLEEMRDNFVYGCNVGMIMADAGCPAARPTEWFTWLALKSVVKGAFGKLASTQFEFAVSVCLLQDDQVMDLLADPPQRFVTLTVAESPLFGNVANGMVYVCVEDAGEFNDVLDASLYRAQEQCNPAAEEQGIVLCTCVLKQVKTSQSTGKEDVIVSSIFASGVGDRVIHYNRIIDKNPAEPRALFYSVMHRSVHSTALFSCAMKDEEIFNYLATLQRFSKIETRRPKLGSTRAFVAYGSSTIPKIREDLEKAKDNRQRAMMQRQLEKLELMVADAEDMLAAPADSAPKTYI